MHQHCSLFCREEGIFFRTFKTNKQKILQSLQKPGLSPQFIFFKKSTAIIANLFEPARHRWNCDTNCDTKTAATEWLRQEAEPAIQWLLWRVFSHTAKIIGNILKNPRSQSEVLLGEKPFPASPTLLELRKVMTPPPLSPAPCLLWPLYMGPSWELVVRTKRASALKDMGKHGGGSGILGCADLRLFTSSCSCRC